MRKRSTSGDAHRASGDIAARREKPGDVDEAPAFHAPASYAADEAVAFHARLTYGDDEDVAFHARRDLDEITTTPREVDRASQRAMISRAILEETITESDAITAPVRHTSASRTGSLSAPARDAKDDLDEATTIPWTRGTGRMAFTWKPT